jgi:hypothetical protein
MQFSWSRHASTYDDENAEDDASLSCLDEPIDELDEDALQDEDPDCEISDEAMLAELNNELDDEIDIVLSHKDTNLGQFAIHKVCTII